MSEHTNIEWADSTFNPWIGCTKVSPACDHCYAERQDARGIFGGAHWGSGVPRKRTSAANWRKPLAWNAQEFVECPACGWRGEWREADVRNGCCPSCNHLPERFKPARRRVFCASLADVFDKEVSDAWRRDLFGLIAATPNIEWLLLTKRVGNVRGMVPVAWLSNIYPAGWPANVWIGATICDQQEADRDIPKLLAVPAAVRFLSIEPMLGPIDLTRWLWGRERSCAGCPMDADCECGYEPRHNLAAEAALDWIIAGGESGPQARPSHPDWFRSLRDQCKAAGVPFLFKQWGEWEIHSTENGHHDCDMARNSAVWLGHDGATAKPSSTGMNNPYAMVKVGKKAAGRLLDGVTHNGFPESRA